MPSRIRDTFRLFSPELALSNKVTDRSLLRRRRFLSLSAALLGTSAVPGYALAQAAKAQPAAAPAAAPAAPAPAQFSFDILSQQMKDKAKSDFQPAEIKLPDFIAQLGYDEYQHIQ